MGGGFLVKKVAGTRSEILLLATGWAILISKFGKAGEFSLPHDVQTGSGAHKPPIQRVQGLFSRITSAEASS
jgi:hypothetical protein